MFEVRRLQFFQGPKQSCCQALKPRHHLTALFFTATSHPSIFGGQGAVIHCSCEELSVRAELSDCWALLGTGEPGCSQPGPGSLTCYSAC